MLDINSHGGWREYDEGVSEEGMDGGGGWKEGGELTEGGL